MDIKTKFKIGDIIKSKTNIDSMGIISKIEIYIVGEIITIVYKTKCGNYIREVDAIQLVEKI